MTSTDLDLALVALYNLECHGVRLYRENLVKKAVDEEAKRHNITSAAIREGAVALVKRSLM
jgi:hypothetical protein